MRLPPPLLPLLQDNHPFGSCPYLHPNEPTQRRDPRLHQYDSIFCYDLHNV